jgi:hypothetical protein
MLKSREESLVFLHDNIQCSIFNTQSENLAPLREITFLAPYLWIGDETQGGEVKRGARGNNGTRERDSLISVIPACSTF